MMNRLKLPGISSVALAFAMMTQPAIAQDQEAGTATRGDRAETAGTVEALTQEIVVTATKKSSAENIQEVPLAVTAFGEQQLEAMKIRDLSGLSATMPNVALEGIATTKGYANFTIRGLGINSSIPSIDPTVGVFVDGMYLGINAGVLLDQFDLEGVEVLRGPQGLLFGRNVTGGAVVINTRKPSDKPEASFRTALESGLRGTGLNIYAMGSVSGPIIGDTVRAKLAVYYNKDNGWHRNYLGGPDFGANPLLRDPGYVARPDAYENFGKAKTFIVRPALTAVLSPDVETTLRFEHGETKGDGAASQNRGIFDRETFRFSVNERGLTDNSWNQLVWTTDIGVAFGNGRITNILGWREYDSRFAVDVDGTPSTIFHLPIGIRQEQVSEELRYAGRFFDKADLTVGLYYFSQDVLYEETRFLRVAQGLLTNPANPALTNRIALNFYGGGRQDHETFGAFFQTDVDLADRLTATVGARYTYEKKSAEIAVVRPQAPCLVSLGTCPIGFRGSETWSKVTPKLGLAFEISDRARAYASWTQGVRSGGYNLRNTDPAEPPKAFDQENVESYELGLKTEPWRGARVNASLFYTQIGNMQREVTIPSPAGLKQSIANTADATIWGAELEAQLPVTSHLVLQGSVGYTNGEYDRIFFDLSGDGVVGPRDFALEIPRLIPWSYAIGLVHEQELARIGSLTTRVNFAHRDRSFFSDSNVGRLSPADMLDFDISLLTADGKTTFSLFGRNLLNDVTEGADSPTGAPLFFGPATYSPLNKGRVFGIEMKRTF